MVNYRKILRETLFVPFSLLLLTVEVHLIVIPLFYFLQVFIVLTLIGLAWSFAIPSYYISESGINMLLLSLGYISSLILMIFFAMIFGPLLVFTLVLRNIYYRLEKKRLGEVQVTSGYGTLLTLLNLEGRAEKFSSKDELTVIESNVAPPSYEMAVADPNAPIVSAEYSGEAELNVEVLHVNKRRGYLKNVYHTSMETIFGHLHDPKKDKKERKRLEKEVREKAEGDGSSRVISLIIHQKILFVFLRPILPLITLLSAFSDSVTVTTWFISAVWYAIVGRDLNLWHSVFFFLATLCIMIVGTAVATSSTVFVYYDFLKRIYFAKIKWRIGEEKMKDPCYHVEDRHLEINLNMYERFGVMFITLITTPLMLYYRFLNLDIIVHLVKQEALIFVKKGGAIYKYLKRERVYHQLQTFW